MKHFNKWIVIDGYKFPSEKEANFYLTYPTTHKRAKDNRLLLYEVKG